MVRNHKQKARLIFYLQPNTHNHLSTPMLKRRSLNELHLKCNSSKKQKYLHINLFNMNSHLSQQSPLRQKSQHKSTYFSCNYIYLFLQCNNRSVLPQAHCNANNVDCTVAAYRQHQHFDGNHVRSIWNSFFCQERWIGYQSRHRSGEARTVSRKDTRFH